MILFVSGRTDIVAFYSEWFLNRYYAGFLNVRNPFYPSQVSKIEFNKVDAIIFCSKNPIPIINRLPEIKKPMVFHITLTPYKKDIEPNVPSKTIIIEAIKKISNIIGIENVFVRYDPIFINEYYTLDYHIRAFDKMCKLLNGFVKNIIISFIDDYKNVRKNKRKLNIKEFTKEDYKQIGIHFYQSASKNHMSIQTCCENIKLLEHGFINSDCLTKEMAFKLTGKTYKKWNARKSKDCNCVEMVDVGVYNSCRHFCKYCYANYDEIRVQKNADNHNVHSSFLIGDALEMDIVKIR